MIQHLALLALTALMFAGGCEAPPKRIVLWHAYQGEERDALLAATARWNAEHPDQQVELVGGPQSSFADKLSSAIPGGNGPDLFIYAQDRIGDWAEAKLIEPLEFWIDDARADRLSDPALAALAYQGSEWGLPFSFKSLVLYYRTDLVAAPPRTTDELFAMAPAMRGKNKDKHALAYPNNDLYCHAPWLSGFGGKVLDGNALAIATPEAAAAMQFARELVTKEVAPGGTEGSMVATLFNEGRVGMAISGPWFVSGIGANVPWKVAALPVVSATGKHAAPFLGVEAIYMSSRAHDKDAAFAVMDALTSDVAAIERAKIAHLVVPNPRAWDDPAVAKDPLLAAYRSQIAHTVRLPVEPSMRMVWTPYQTALGEVIGGRAEPGEKLLAVEREVAGYIKGASGAEQLTSRK